MQQITVILVFIWTVQNTFSANQPCANSCVCPFNDTMYIDLSNVGRRDGMTRFFMLQENENVSVLYSYNPCHPISYRTEDFIPDQHSCKDVAACIIKPGSSSGSLATQRALGYQRGAVIFYDSASDEMKINYTVPDHDSTKTSLTVTLKCKPDVMHELEIKNETSFILSTKCACPGHVKIDDCRAASSDSKSGLSTGSILLITFFVILLVYVGFGILFNFCKGAHGTELLPNFEFWNELPKLIVDGFLFTCSCFGRRSSYADV